jgi:hypothetical protein
MYDGAKLPMVFCSQSYGADYAERWLSCIAQVPQGGLMWIMGGDAGCHYRASAGGWVLYVRRNRADSGDARFPQPDAGRLVD